MFLNFIVPVYNTEPYLKDCLDSLLAQDSKAEEFEIICVNDGSTDNSLQILQDYADRFGNVHVYSQENKGVCTARNLGLEKASGKYIHFVDSDDCVSPHSLSLLMEAANTDPDRIIIGNYRFKDGTLPFKNIESLPQNTIWQDSSACRSVLKKSFLDKNGLCFSYLELIYGEDALFMYELKYANPKTITINAPIYGYRDREDSASHTTQASIEKQLFSTIREAEIMKNYYESGRTDTMTVDRFMSFLFGALYHVAAMADRPKYKEYLRIMREKGLFPYKRPKNCTIRKSYQMNRGDWIEKIHDKIYINISSQIGFRTMRCWNSLFRIKNRLARR